VTLEVTEGALAFIRAALATAEPTSEKTFRLVEHRGGFEIGFGVPNEEDNILLSGGLRVLCVSPDVARLAFDTTIDVEDTPAGRHLTFCVH
jgi:hypothetical protein